MANTHTVYRLTKPGAAQSGEDAASNALRSLKADTPDSISAALDKLNPGREPIPSPTAHEVLIRVRGVSLNYRDIIIATGKYPFAISPDVIPCSDAAGEVTAIGKSVKGFKLGDKVVATFDPGNLYGPLRDFTSALGGPADGVLREYMTLPAAAVAKIPDDAPQSYTEWSTTVCAGQTAWNALYGGNNPLKAGQTVLLQGTGGVSLMGLVFAKAAGATTIVTSSSDEKLAYVKEKFGADHGINYNTHTNWAAEVNKLTGGNGVDFVLENGGSGTIKQSIDSLTFGGTVAIIGFLAPTAKEDMPDVSMLALLKNATVRGIAIGTREHLGDIVKLVSSRKLRLPVDREFGFSREEVIQAYNYIASGKMIGKVCINIS